MKGRNKMRKSEALNKLIAYACCNNSLCEKCPLSKKECKEVIFTRENIISAINELRNIEMTRIKLSDIIIPKAFTDHPPKENKVEICRHFWKYAHKQDREIVVDKDNVIRDGYIQYLVLKEFGVEEVLVAKQRCFAETIYRNKRTTYIYGLHPRDKSNKERVWRVPNSWIGWEKDLLPGDRILVHTEYGIKSIVITRIEWLDKCPVNMRVRKVYKK